MDLLDYLLLPLRRAIKWIFAEKAQDVAEHRELESEAESEGRSYSESECESYEDSFDDALDAEVYGDSAEYVELFDDDSCDSRTHQQDIRFGGGTIGRSHRKGEQ